MHSAYTSIQSHFALKMYSSRIPQEMKFGVSDVIGKWYSHLKAWANVFLGVKAAVQKFICLANKLNVVPNVKD